MWSTASGPRPAQDRPCVHRPIDPGAARSRRRAHHAGLGDMPSPGSRRTGQERGGPDRRRTPPPTPRDATGPAGAPGTARASPPTASILAPRTSARPPSPGRPVPANRATDDQKVGPGPDRRGSIRIRPGTPGRSSGPALPPARRRHRRHRTRATPHHRRAPPEKQPAPPPRSPPPRSPGRPRLLAGAGHRIHRGPQPGRVGMHIHLR